MSIFGDSNPVRKPVGLGAYPCGAEPNLTFQILGLKSVLL